MDINKQLFKRLHVYTESYYLIFCVIIQLQLLSEKRIKFKGIVEKKCIICFMIKFFHCFFIIIWQKCYLNSLKSHKGKELNLLFICYSCFYLFEEYILHLKKLIH